jgi:molecular chaperone DnaK (HSP70)
LIDVIPQSLGIETFKQGIAGFMSFIIERGSVIPITKTKNYTTAVENQDSVFISVYEGEHELIKENNELGNFTLHGFPLAPKGEPKIEVTFDVDKNAILFVTARDLNTGSEESITLEVDKSGISKGEIERMI